LISVAKVQFFLINKHACPTFFSHFSIFAIFVPLGAVAQVAQNGRSFISRMCSDKISPVLSDRFFGL
jgi:hypothetical protein